MASTPVICMRVKVRAGPALDGVMKKMSAIKLPCARSLTIIALLFTMAWIKFFIKILRWTGAIRGTHGGNSYATLQLSVPSSTDIHDATHAQDRNGYLPYSPSIIQFVDVRINTLTALPADLLLHPHVSAQEHAHRQSRSCKLNITTREKRRENNECNV